MKKQRELVVLKYLRLIMMLIVYCFLERENYKVLKIHAKNS